MGLLDPVGLYDLLVVICLFVVLEPRAFASEMIALPLSPSPSKECL